jgi:hypothetical protein
MFDPLERVVELVDPAHAGAGLGGEPGWHISRQMVPGEALLFEQRMRRKYANAKPGPLVTTDPPANAGPDSTWPAWARFKVELGFPDEFGNPKYPLQYYDAATFEKFLRMFLEVYVKHHPDASAQAEKILKHAAYWAEHDAHRGGAPKDVADNR